MSRGPDSRRSATVFLQAPPDAAVRVFTVGHSNTGPERLLRLLREAGVRRVADVRRVPQSRHVPWAGRDALPGVLALEQVAYVHAEALGARREPMPDSVNDALDDAAFRGYADHMSTRGFTEALDEVVAWAAEAPTALMCAEADFSGCHRRFVADALTARGVEVVHLADDGPVLHALSERARVADGVVTYPRAPGRQARLF